MLAKKYGREAKKREEEEKKKKEAAESSNVMTDAELEALGLPTLSSLQKLKNKLASVVSSPVPEDVTALSRPPPMVIMQPPQPLPPPVAASSFVDPVAPLSPRGFFVANSPAFSSPQSRKIPTSSTQSSQSTSISSTRIPINGNGTLSFEKSNICRQNERLYGNSRFLPTT